MAANVRRCCVEQVSHDRYSDGEVGGRLSRRCAGSPYPRRWSAAASDIGRARRSPDSRTRPSTTRCGPCNTDGHICRGVLSIAPALHMGFLKKRGMCPRNRSGLRRWCWAPRQGRRIFYFRFFRHGPLRGSIPFLFFHPAPRCSYSTCSTLDGWLYGWLVGWLVGWLAGQSKENRIDDDDVLTQRRRKLERTVSTRLLCHHFKV